MNTSQHANLVAQLFRKKDESSVIYHLTASLKILEKRGPSSHTSGIEHQLFVDLRHYWVSIKGSL